MWGQWIGEFRSADKPDATGGLCLNVDQDSHERGRLAIYPFVEPAKGVWADVIFQANADQPRATLFLPAIQPHNMPGHGELVFEQRSDTLLSGTFTSQWAGNAGAGSFALRRSGDIAPTVPDRRFRTWGAFKKWLVTNPGGTLIYRGQSNNRWRLVTSLHRTGRVDLQRYGVKDVPQLNRYIAGILDRQFDLSQPFENGALLNLAQHHGFPTPLLDWTESPYIAAYFAYSELPKMVNSGKVRIFIFDSGAWQNDRGGNSEMHLPAPYLSIHQFLPIYNSRALPQQSVVTSTNLLDIEGWLKTQQPPHRQYLMKVDLPAAERATVMADLTSMGITAASLFPGLEGTCRALKERLF